MPFRLTTFGELSLRDVATERALRVPRKALALLAVLASAGANGSVAREKILGLLWPDAGDSGRGALKQTVYELRQTLGTSDVIVGTTELSLDSSLVTSDVADFATAFAAREWRRAAELYGGPFLEGFAARGAAEFDHWADGQRAYYHTRYATALQQAADDAARAGDLHEAVALWRRLANAEPLSARSAAGLINALAAAGDATGALAHFRIHSAIIARELGAEPDASLVALVERLRVRVRSERMKPEEHIDERQLGEAPQDETKRDAAVKRGRLRRSTWTGLSAIGLLALSTAAAAAVWHERTHAHVLATVLLPHDSFRIAVDGGSRIYVDGGAAFGASMTVISADSLRERRVPYGAGVLVDPVTHWYWSGDYGGHAVIIRNGFTDAELGRIPVRGCPHFFVPYGDSILVAEQCNDQIAVVDNRTRRLVREIPIATLSRTDVGGAKGMGAMHVNTNTGIVYFDKDEIPERLDPRTWEIRETPGFGGVVIGVNQLLNRLYARMDGGIRVIDGATEKVLAEIALPAAANSLAVGVGGRRVYVATSKGIVVIDGSSEAIRSVLSIADGFEPHEVAVDEARGRAYVVGWQRGRGSELKVLHLGD